MPAHLRDVNHPCGVSCQAACTHLPSTGMSTTRARQDVDETVVRVVRSLMSWHGLAMPDVAAAIDASIGTVERRLSRNPATRKSFLGWELQVLADYFGVPVGAFYTGDVDLRSSRLSPGPSRQICSYVPSALGELVAA